MKSTLPKDSLNERLERECERERHERALNDEQRAGICSEAEFRSKDAREKTGLVNVKRPPGR